MEDMYFDEESKPIIKRLSKLLKLTSIISFVLILCVCMIPFKVLDFATTIATMPDQFMSNGFFAGLFIAILAIAHLAVILAFCIPVWKAYKMHKYLEMLVATGDSTMLSLVFKNLTHILYCILLIVLLALPIVGMALFFLL
ncbi:MAG: hypothetical protein MJZ33_04195 [Paludibacteraceae bacterium]|nr:hypothetical protein [Paludibacteraceae bacterium]